MRVGSELRPRMTLRVDGALCRVIAAEYHGGEGKMGGVMHAKLHDLQTGKEREQVAIDEARLGKAAARLKEERVVPVELVDGGPLGIIFPEIAEAWVAETAEPYHTPGTDNVWKRGSRTGSR